MVMAEPRPRAIVMIPTYNERKNIQGLVDEILGLNLPVSLSVLVVDDNSPDGTGEVVRGLAEKEPRLQLLVRTGRRGRGAAGIDGFKEALRLGADYIIEMDGDFSHDPRFIAPLLEAAEKSDVVIGSRFVSGGRDEERNPVRRFLTCLVRHFIRRHFRLPVHDVSSGFRCFRRRVLEELTEDNFVSIGPSLVLEVLYRAWLAGFRLTEVPIVFHDRRGGKTKLTLAKLLETLVTVLKFKRLYGAPQPRMAR